MNTRSKKRLSILKRSSMSSNENSSPVAETVTNTKPSKRISFSRRLSVKEFASGDDCITIWNNSYEKSDEHCNTAVNPDENAAGTSNLTKSVITELPIMSGPNKENIIVNNELSLPSENISMSTTLQMDITTMTLNNILYKTPSKVIHKIDNPNVENDSMDIEELEKSQNMKDIKDKNHEMIIEDFSDNKTEPNSCQKSIRKTKHFENDKMNFEDNENPVKLKNCYTSVTTQDMDMSLNTERMSIVPAAALQSSSKDSAQARKTIFFQNENLEETMHEHEPIAIEETYVQNEAELKKKEESIRKTKHFKNEQMALELGSRLSKPSKRYTTKTTQDMDVSLTTERMSIVPATINSNRTESTQTRKTTVFQNANIMEDTLNEEIVIEETGIKYYVAPEKKDEPSKPCQRKTKYFENEQMALESDNKPLITLPKRYTNITPLNMDTSLTTERMSIVTETLLQPPSNHADSTQTRKTMVFQNANIMEDTISEQMAIEEIYLKSEVSSEKKDEQSKPCQRKTKYFENDQMALESENKQLISLSKRYTNIAPLNMDTSLTTERMSIVPETLLPSSSNSKDVSSQNKQTSIRQSVYVAQPINETLVSDSMENECDSISNQPTKNSLKRDRRHTTVELLSMDVSTLNVTPRSENPIKKDRKEESKVYSDIDSTLQNTTHYECSRPSSDMDITKPVIQYHKIDVKSNQKENSLKINTPSRIPKPRFKTKLESKLAESQNSISLETPKRNDNSNRAVLKDLKVPKISRQTIYDTSIDVDVNDTIDKDKGTTDSETLVPERHIDYAEQKENENQSSNQTENDLLNVPQDDSQFISPPKCMNFNMREITELSIKRFRDLHNTMQQNESLNKISDIELTINSTLTSAKESNNESIYPQCSFANITNITSFETPDVSTCLNSGKESGSANLGESCVCPETTISNSFSVSSLEGLSPNVSARLSFGNEIFEQIRQRVLNRTAYCKNCKCLSGPRSTGSPVNGKLTTTTSLVDWTRFPQVPSKLPSIDYIEKEFLNEWAKLNTSSNVSKQYPEVPSVSVLLENLRKSVDEHLDQEIAEHNIDQRCPAPYPANKPYVYLLKNKLDSESIPWTVRSLHAPIGIIQLRNNKLKSVLLHVCLEPKSLKDKNEFLKIETVKIVQNHFHPPSSPFTFVLLQNFAKQFSLDSSFLHMCKDYNDLFDFLVQMDEKISEIHANIQQLFSILKEHKTTVFMENSCLKAHVTIINEEIEVIRVTLNLADPYNFNAGDINSYPEDPSLKERSNRFNLKGIDFLEYFLSNIKNIVLNK